MWGYHWQNFYFIHQRKSDLKTVQEEDEVYDGEETIDYWFYVNRWFASDEDDKQIIRELIPTDKDGKPLRKALDGRNLSNFGSEKLLLITRVSFNLQVQTFSI